MIGTHDSFTYLRGNGFNELFSFLWRTQDLSITEQYDKGVRYFDVRVRRKHLRGYAFPVWVICHGMVDFHYESLTLENILKDLPEKVKVRFVLERGSREDEQAFKLEIRALLEDVNQKFDSAYIKKGWRTVSPTYYKIKDYTYVPWNTGKGFFWNLKHFKLSTIKKWAKKHNPEFNSGHKGSKVVHFVDFI